MWSIVSEHFEECLDERSNANKFTQFYEVSKVVQSRKSMKELSEK